MKSFLFALFFLFAVAPLHAELKWERTRQKVIVKAKGNAVEAEFPYTNTGNKEVVITKVRGACACCTKAKATLKKIPPGGKGMIKVWASLQKKPLPLVKALSVTTDDGQTTVLLVDAVAEEKTPEKKR